MGKQGKQQRASLISAAERAADIASWPCAATIAMSSALLLVACDSGGISQPPNQAPTARFTATPETGPPPLAVSFNASSSRDVDGTIAHYQWDFGGGATGSGRMASHTFEKTGTHSVRLTVTDDDGATATASEELIVNANPVARIVADPVGGTAPLTVSFDGQSSADPDGTIETYAWDFGFGAGADGATATRTFSEAGLYAVRLTVTDDLAGTGEVVFELNVRHPDRDDIDFAVPYVADGAHATDLNPCLYALEAGACTMERLPFLGAEFDDPTVDDVMSRVLVSHRWMGDNLKTLLKMLPVDIRLLARSLTGIVIATSIRPAHYRPSTGAIYLDADFFWRTAEQRAVVSQEPDYRAAFQRKLQLLLPWRFVRNNQRFAIRRDADGARLTEDVAVYLGFLLFHELSHAADFIHVSRIDGLDPSWTPWDAALLGYPEGWRDWASSTLQTAHPLQSELLRGIAKVSFLGEEPTAEQAALLPRDIVTEFANDGAVDYYSYSSQYEDLADLHTAALMSYHFGQEQDTAITDNPSDANAPRVVAWGQRGRMTNTTVIDRTRFVLEALYPGDVQELVGYVSGRPPPLPMRAGESWNDNIVLEGGEDFNAKTPTSATPPAFSSWPALQGGTGARVPGAATESGRNARDAIYLGCIRLDSLSGTDLTHLPSWVESPSRALRTGD